MDEAFQIKQYILNDGFDEFSQQHVEEESLEHLYNSIIMILTKINRKTEGSTT